MVIMIDRLYRHCVVPRLSTVYDRFNDIIDNALMIISMI